MSKSAVPLAFALLLLTGYVLGQLREIATVRSDLSVDVAAARSSVVTDGPVESSLELLSTLSPIEAAISPRTPRLERLTLERFAQNAIPTHGGTLIAVESGELIVHVSGFAITSHGDQSEVLKHSLTGIFRLRAGETVAIAPHASFRLSNSSLQQARLLVLTVPHFDRASEPELAPARTSLPHGVNRLGIVHGTVIAPNRGPVRVDLYRVASSDLGFIGLSPPGAELLFAAAESLLVATEFSRIPEAGSADFIWIATISAATN